MASGRLQPVAGPSRRSALCIALLATLPAAIPAARAAQINYSIGGRVEHSDNIALTQTNPMEESTLATDVAFDVTQTGRNTTFVANGGVEYLYYTGEAWHARNTHGGIDADDMAALLKINTDGRLRFVEGDDQEVLPGIRAYTGGRHTWASQFVSVLLRASAASAGQAATANGTAIFTSDNVYLYENLDKHAPIAQTLDAASNLKAQDRVRALAANPRLIVPGHDPAVFERFERVADGIARIK